MTTWIGITAPAVGNKITAAGFGAQVDTAVQQLQDETDTDRIREHARPGGDVSSLVTPAPVSVSAGPTTVVSTPASGRRIVKQLWLSGPAAATVTLIIAGVGTTIAKLSLTGGIFVWPTTIPLAAGESLTATVTGGPVIVMPSYVDRTDTAVTRLGLASGASSGTLIASTGSDRVITQLWIASTSLAAAGTARLAVGGTDVVDDVAMAAGSLLTLDDPIQLPAGTAVTWAGDATTAITFMAAGRTA